jgi:hypothetical protein
MAEIVGQSTYNNARQLVSVNSQNQLQIIEGVSPYPSGGGHYSVAGQSTSIPASLAANSTLMSMRFATTATTNAYITRVRVVFVVSTGGTSTLVAGTMGLQRFSAATPSGGTSRTANINEMDELLSTSSSMLDIRDSNAALTVTSVVFGNVVASCIVPIAITSGGWFSEWIFEPPQPLVLRPGEGVSLTSQVAMPATQTWQYSYTIYWQEK